jgi:hypothetical protein
MENSVVVSDYAAMDRILREERKHILGLCKKIKKSGCNVLLIQKSILRDAYNDLSLHFLAKMDVSVKGTTRHILWSGAALSPPLTGMASVIPPRLISSLVLVCVCVAPLRSWW